MPASRTYLRSFAGGQISQEMSGRIDDTRYQTGLKKARNFITLPHGPAVNRPGSIYVANTKNNGKVRLETFQFSITQQLVIEIGAGYFRMFDQNGPVQLATGSPTEWAAYRQIVSWNFPGSPDIKTDDPYPAPVPAVGDKVRVWMPPGAALPQPFLPDTTYYVVSVVANNPYLEYELATYAGGPSITWSQSGSSNVGRLSRYYELGDYLTYGGNYYVCIQAHEAREITNPSSAPTYWQQVSVVGQLEVTNPYAEEHLFEIDLRQSNDVITFTHRSYPVYELRRYATNQWLMTTVEFKPTLPAPSNVAAVIGSTGDRFKARLVNNSSTPAANGDISPSRWHVVADGFMTLLDGDTIYVTDRGGTAIGQSGAILVDLYTEYIIDGISAQGFNLREVGTRNGVRINAPFQTTMFMEFHSQPLASVDYNYYKVTAVDRDGRESQASDTVSVLLNNLLVDGAWNQITWNAVDGALSYRVYKKTGESGSYGWIADVDQTEATPAGQLSLKDDNIDPELDRVPPLFDNSLSGTDYPGAVGYHQGRRAFGGTTLFPQQSWLTRSGTESDLSFSIPFKDDDAVTFEVAALEAATILHLVSVGQLIALTNSAEFSIQSPEDSVITPDSVEVTVQSSIGANFVDPVVVNNIIVFCSTSGHVHGIGWRADARGFVPIDLSLRAADLFDGFQIQDMTLCRSPYPIVWMASTSGKLLGLTLVPDQDVLGWHWHDSGAAAEIESVARLRIGTEDILYMSVKRTINGSTVRYIERLAPLLESDLTQMVLVDAAKVITGSGLTGVQSGFDHLIGETVSLMGDGIYLGQQVVNASGEVNLGTGAYDRVTVGIPIAAEAHTLPATVQLDGYGQGRPKNVTAATLRTVNSGTFRAGPSLDNMTWSNPYSPVVTGALVAETLADEDVDVTLPAAWGDGGQIYISQTLPLPVKIAGMTLEVVYGG